MKFKHRSIFIAITISLFIITGCQPAATTVTSAATPCSGDSCLPPTLIPTQKPVPTVTPTVLLGDQRPGAKDQTITFWHTYPLDNIGLVNSLVEDFNRSNPDGILVKTTAFYTDEQLRDALNNIEDPKDKPDVIMSEEALLNSLDKNGSTTNLVDYISDPLIGLSGDQQNAIPDRYWRGVTRQNKVVGLPAQNETFFFLYNQTWAKELGFDEAPKTFADFSVQTKAALEANIPLKDKIPGTGGWLINWRPSTALAWMGPEFVIPDDGQTFNQPILSRTFEELKKIQLTNAIWLGLNPDPVPYFVNRQALFISSSSRELAEMIVHMTALKMQDSWSIIAYPQFSISENHFTLGDAFGLLSETQEKQLAGWLFIRWMMNPDHQAYIGSHGYTIPADQVAVDKLTDFSSQAEIIQTLVKISAGSDNFSSSPNWYITESILADSFRQLFQPETTLELIPNIITEMDLTYSEYRQ